MSIKIINVNIAPEIKVKIKALISNLIPTDFFRLTNVHTDIIAKDINVAIAAPSIPIIGIKIIFNAMFIIAAVKNIFPTI